MFLKDNNNSHQIKHIWYNKKTMVLKLDKKVNDSVL